MDSLLAAVDLPQAQAQAQAMPHIKLSAPPPPLSALSGRSTPSAAAVAVVTAPLSPVSGREDDDADVPPMANRAAAAPAVPAAPATRCATATVLDAVHWKDAAPAVLLRLCNKQWMSAPGADFIPWIEQPRVVGAESLLQMPIKGRNSCKEKEAEKVSVLCLQLGSI
jgi:hypothetical protein|eukprot:COSAG01_NODE_3239_length_6369_cov_4.207018_5_plen_167_part_00